jgi:predicted O-methyltransferase YrrM
MMETFVKEKLTVLEATRKDFWNLPHESANFINMLIKAQKCKNVLEIGTSNGYSAIWHCDALRETGGHLVSLEFWQKRIDLAEANLRECNLLEYATIKCGSAKDLIPSLTPEDFNSETLELDMVFIDANKAEYIKYFELVHPLIKKGGIILADNVSSHHEKVQPFLEVIYSHPEYQAELLPFDGGLLMAYKKETA